MYNQQDSRSAPDLLGGGWHVFHHLTSDWGEHFQVIICYKPDSEFFFSKPVSHLGLRVL